MNAVVYLKANCCFLHMLITYLAILGQGECCGKERVACKNTNLQCSLGIHYFQKHRQETPFINWHRHLTSAMEISKEKDSIHKSQRCILKIERTPEILDYYCSRLFRALEFITYSISNHLNVFLCNFLACTCNS